MLLVLAAAMVWPTLAVPTVTLVNGVEMPMVAAGSWQCLGACAFGKTMAKHPLSAQKHSNAVLFRPATNQARTSLLSTYRVHPTEVQQLNSIPVHHIRAKSRLHND